VPSSYSNDPSNPTPLVWTGSVSPYKRRIKGSVGDSDKADYLTFKVLPNQKLTSITLTLYNSTDGIAFIGLQEGSQIIQSSFTGTTKNWTHFGPAQEDAVVGTNLISKLGGTLTEGTYSIWIQQLGAKTDYSFNLQLEEISRETNQILNGGPGNDIINGGTGADTMIGGLGNDTYVVDHAGDMVTEKENQGIDNVQSSVSFSLGDYLENLTLTGSEAINATGNTAANTLTGNSSNNTLNGGAGVDILTGLSSIDTTLGRGTVDTLTGGTENDTFILGDTRGFFYSDGSTATSGKSDYARITDFASGDKIQLKGKSSDYILKKNYSVIGVTGKGYGLYRNDGVGLGATTGLDDRDEFIALIQSQTNFKLNLANTSQFTYI